MADSVRITIEADDQTAAGIASAVANLGKLEKAAKSTTGSAAGGSGTGVKGLGAAFGGLNQILGSIGLPALGFTAALGGIAAAAKNAIQVSSKYNEEVRDLSLVTGTGAEKTSRLLQVLDDYQIGAEDVTVATKALTKNGLVPTVDTIAKLSDEYLRLNDAQDKNAFILKNFGKGGLNWVNLLQQGSDKILDLNDGVNENLILTDEQIKAYEQYRLRMDNVTDTIQGFKVAAGNAFFDFIDSSGQAAEKSQAVNNRLREMGLVMGDQARMRSPIVDQLELMYNQAEATGVSFEKLTAPLDSATMSYIAMARAAQQTGSAMDSIDYAELLKNSLAITKQNTAYSDALAKINAQYDDSGFVTEVFKGKVADLKNQLADGDITNRQYYSSVQDLTRALKDGTLAADERKRAQAQLDAQIDAAAADQVLNLLDQRKATDEQKIAFAEASGKITKGAADQARAQSGLADAYLAGKISADAYASAINAISGDLSKLDGMSATAYVNVIVNSQGSTWMLKQNTIGNNGGVLGGTGVSGRAIGDPNVMPGMYEVGEKGAEGMAVSSSGRVSIIPAGLWNQMKRYGVQPADGFAAGISMIPPEFDPGRAGRQGVSAARNLSRGRIIRSSSSSHSASSMLSSGAADAQAQAQTAIAQQSAQQAEAQMNTYTQTAKAQTDALTQILSTLKKQSTRADDYAIATFTQRTSI